MTPPSIKIRRYPYEEPYHLNLRIAASSGRLNGQLEYYCNATDLSSLGRQLADFSGKRSEEVVYELGSEKPEDRFAYFLSLRVKILDDFGHCALLVRINNNRTVPEREICEFCIKAEVPDINRLGKLMIEFGHLQHLVLDWSVQDGCLTKTEEVKPENWNSEANGA